MKLPRRQFLYLAAGAAALPAASGSASAQVYPSRPVRWVVPYPAGGTPDTIARLIGQWLSERLGQPFVIDNRAGGGSNIGTEAVVKAPADGYALLLVTATNAVNVTLYDKLDFNFIRDIAPVASVLGQPLVMAANPLVPANTVPEFIAYAKANPGKLNFASGGNGTILHVAGELFKIMAGVDMVHVPYRGGLLAVPDLLAGRVQIIFSPPDIVSRHIRAGTLRGLAVTNATRLETLPELPPLGDFVPGFEVRSWVGVGVPRNTPIEIIDKLNREINLALGDPTINARFAALEGTVLSGSPADFGKLITAETEKWGNVIRMANIKPE